MILRRSRSSPNLGEKEPLVFQVETNSNSTMGFWFMNRLAIVIFSDGMKSEYIFVLKKNFKDGSEIFFSSNLHIRDGSEIGKFRPNSSHCRLLRMKVFLIRMESCRILYLLERDRDIFLSQKKYKDGSGTFFHLTYIYEMRL